MKKSLLSLLLFPLSLHAYIPGYEFVVEGHPVHFNIFGRFLAKSDFVTPPAANSNSFSYKDGQTSLFYTLFTDEKRALSFEIGQNLLSLDWEKNPYFKKNNYANTKASISYINDCTENWRFIVALGGMADSQTMNIDKTGMGYGFLWGRYDFNNKVQGNIGVFARTGLEETSILPIIGIKAKPTERITLTAIYPVALTATFALSEQWLLCAASSSLNDFDSIPMRAKEGIGAYKDGIFSIHGKGADLSLIFNYKNGLIATLGGGYTFPGHILVSDKNHQNEKRHNFKGARYAIARFYLTL